MSKPRKKRLVIAVTGTPGTGKTSVARLLARRLKAKLVDLNALILKKKLFELDAAGERVANLRKTWAAFAEVLKKSKGPVVVEGLLAHLLPKKYLTHVLVLRTRPKVLERRLKARGYSGLKLQDNLEAEALGIILWEAVHKHGIERVYEIDTTRLSPAKSVKTFLNALEGKVSLRPGKIDWLEEFYAS